MGSMHSWLSSVRGEHGTELLMRNVTFFEQAPPLSVGLTPDGRLDLAPISALPGAVRGITAPAHHTFEDALLGHPQQRQPAFEGFYLEEVSWIVRGSRAARSAAYCKRWTSGKSSPREPNHADCR